MMTYEEAKKYGEPFVVTTDKGENYEGLFVSVRIDRKTVPDGYGVYDIADYDSTGIMCRIAKSVMVNHYGTFVCDRKIPGIEKEQKYFQIDPEEWGFIRDEPCPENEDSDYQATFGTLEKEEI